MLTHALLTTQRLERLERTRRSPESIVLPQELEITDILVGADPYLHFDPHTGLYTLPWYREETKDVLGVEGMTILQATTPEGLALAMPEPLTFSSISPRNKETWAPEIHTFNGKYYLYIADSDGENKNHRMQVYEAPVITGPYTYKGQLCTLDDCWAIDLTVFSLPSSKGDELYGVWSGWTHQYTTSDFPQNLYIAKMDTPWSFSSERHMIAEPKLPWTRAVQPILEGPQAFYAGKFFRGLTFAADASWTTAYTTGVLWYCGGDPLHASSWSMALNPLFPKGYGLGHGMFVPGSLQGEFITHRKSLPSEGWEDRVICKVSASSLLLEMMRQDALAPR